MFLYWLVVFAYIAWPMYLYPTIMVGPQTFGTPLLTMKQFNPITSSYNFALCDITFTCFFSLLFSLLYINHLCVTYTTKLDAVLHLYTPSSLFSSFHHTSLIDSSHSTSQPTLPRGVATIINAILPLLHHQHHSIALARWPGLVSEMVETPMMSVILLHRLLNRGILTKNQAFLIFSDKSGSSFQKGVVLLLWKVLPKCNLSWEHTVDFCLVKVTGAIKHWNYSIRKISHAHPRYQTRFSDLGNHIKKSRFFYHIHKYRFWWQHHQFDWSIGHPLVPMHVGNEPLLFEMETTFENMYEQISLTSTLSIFLCKTLVFPPLLWVAQYYIEPAWGVIGVIILKPLQITFCLYFLDYNYGNQNSLSQNFNCCEVGYCSCNVK